jgi:hypothetical protein
MMRRTKPSWRQTGSYTTYFGRGRAESTTRKYAEAIALYAQLAARHDGVVHERNCHRSAYSLL